MMGKVETYTFDISYFPLSFISCLCCLLLYFYIAPVLSSYLLPAYGHFDKKTKLLWNNYILSTAHSIVVISFCLYSFYYEPWLIEDPVSEESVIVRSSCAIVTGYMIADTFATVVHYRYIGEPGYIFHHFACIYGYYATLIYGVLCFFANFRLMAELSTPFVNLRWMLSTIGYSKTNNTYFINGLLMLGTFYTVRIIAMPYYWYKVFTIFNTVEFNNLGYMRLIPYVPCAILDILNIQWGYKMYLGAKKAVMAKTEMKDS